MFGNSSLALSDQRSELNPQAAFKSIVFISTIEGCRPNNSKESDSQILGVLPAKLVLVGKRSLNVARGIAIQQARYSRDAVQQT